MQGNPQAAQMIMLLIFAVLFYFMLLRPQKIQQKERDAMLKSLSVGDKVLTVGGLYGEITEMHEKSIRVRIAKDVVVRMTRSGIQSKTSLPQED